MAGGPDLQADEGLPPDMLLLEGGAGGAYDEDGAASLVSTGLTGPYQVCAKLRCMQEGAQLCWKSEDHTRGLLLVMGFVCAEWSSGVPRVSGCSLVEHS
jgi:hypothetical protein